MVWYAWMDGFFRCGMDRIHGKMYEYRRIYNIDVELVPMCTFM